MATNRQEGIRRQRELDPWLTTNDDYIHRVDMKHLLFSISASPHVILLVVRGSLNDAFVSSTGEEEDDEQHRSDSKPAQVKRRQSVFSKLGSNRQKKVYFRPILLFMPILVFISRFYCISFLCRTFANITELLRLTLAVL